MRRLNYVAAFVTFFFDLVWMYLKTAGRRAEFSSATQSFLTFFIMVGAISWAILTVSMLYFWLTFERGTTWGGTFWLLGICLTPLITIVYCFTSYRTFARIPLDRSSTAAEPVAF